MKRTTVLFGLFVALIFALSVESNAQGCGSMSWLNDQVIPNVTFQLLNTLGQPVTSVNPGTNYILRVTATGGICLINGSGCGTGAAPTAFMVIFASGCTVEGRTIPPDLIGRDVGSGNNYTANFNITTLPSGSFGGQVLVLVRARGTEVGICGFEESTSIADFNSLTDL